MYKGEIANFPAEIVEKMLSYQEKQGNERNVEIFEEYASRNRVNGGFDWNYTNEGIAFWCNVIDNEKFDLFFEKYPRVNSTTQLTFDFTGKLTDEIIMMGKTLQWLSIKNDFDESSGMQCKVTFKTEYLPSIMQVVERMNLTIVNDTLTDL